MFYDALKNNHGLPHDPVNALVAPRPIGWISTMSKAGIRNLATYSFFNLMAGQPPVVVFGSATVKDTQRNAEETGEFVCNVADWDLREEVNATSTLAPAEVDEFEYVGLEAESSTLVRPPRVKRAKAALECKYVQTVALPTGSEKPHFCAMVVGLVVGIYIDDSVIREGMVDVRKIRPIARLGYFDFSVVDDVFEMLRPAYTPTDSVCRRA
jgi:flavin reductase (DIM6/NTAB) family NADH-FMN oxidoreductase RutF